MIISSNLCHGSLKKKKKEVSRWRLVNLPPRYARYFLIEKLFPLVFIIIHSVSSIYVISDNQSLHRVCLFGCVNTFESKNALSIEIISFFFFFFPPNTRIIIVVISVNAKTPRNIFFPLSLLFFLLNSGKLRSARRWAKRGKGWEIGREKRRKRVWCVRRRFVDPRSAKAGPPALLPVAGD